MHADHLPVLAQLLVPVSETIEEEMFLGLRTMAGVHEDRFYRRVLMTVDAVYGETVPELESTGLIERTNGVIRLTNRGQFLGNEVYSTYCLDEPLVV